MRRTSSRGTLIKRMNKEAPIIMGTTVQQLVEDMLSVEMTTKEASITTEIGFSCWPCNKGGPNVCGTWMQWGLNVTVSEETLISVESDAWQMEMEFLENKEALVNSDTATPEIREIFRRVSKNVLFEIPELSFSQSILLVEETQAMANESRFFFSERKHWRNCRTLIWNDSRICKRRGNVSSKYW